jgi:hypothetical protein
VSVPSERRHHAPLLGPPGERRTKALVGELFRIALERRNTFDASRPSTFPWPYGIGSNLWHRFISASVHECMEAWTPQREGGPVTVEALETILARATLPILRQVEGRPPELVVALLLSLVRTMLAAFLEAMAEQRPTRPT